jgi:hypothetical protein
VILNLGKLHGTGALLVIIGNVIDPRADRIAAHSAAHRRVSASRTPHSHPSFPDQATYTNPNAPTIGCTKDTGAQSTSPLMQAGWAHCPGVEAVPEMFTVARACRGPVRMFMGYCSLHESTGGWGVSSRFARKQ